MKAADPGPYRRGSARTATATPSPATTAAQRFRDRRRFNLEWTKPTRQTVENTGTGIGKGEMRNRIRGEYRDLRCAAGGVHDDGFGVIRVSFGKICDAVGPELDRRRQGERASIRWIVP